MEELCLYNRVKLFSDKFQSIYHHHFYIFCLQMMGGSGFLQGLLTFNKDTINGETVELLEPYLRMEDYNLETAKKVI